MSFFSRVLFFFFFQNRPINFGNRPEEGQSAIPADPRQDGRATCNFLELVTSGLGRYSADAWEFGKEGGGHRGKLLFLGGGVGWRRGGGGRNGEGSR